MPRFSANLGYLWTEHPITTAIERAVAAGFDAVECHTPYATPAQDLCLTLNTTGCSMLGINTATGGPDHFGLAACPGREDQALALITQALNYAQVINAPNVHVLAGRSNGDDALNTFCANLKTATGLAAAQGTTILIEPLNAHDAPGYFLNTTDQAARIIDRVGAPNLKLMFDCYHVARTEGQITDKLTSLLPIIGHIQFAGVPDRGPPDQGILDYRSVFDCIDDLGWTTPLGAEYRPPGPTDTSLGWMKSLT